MEKVLPLKANYKITKTSNKTLTRIFCELKNISVAKNFESVLEKIVNKDKKTILFISNGLKDYSWIYKSLLKETEGHNIIPLAFRGDLAKKIAWETTSNTFEVNYIALGTDWTPETENDTTLGAEILRGPLTKREATDNIAYLDKFFWTSEVWGTTIREIGLFVDGTASADTGVLLSRITINEVMGANETLTINASITINSAT